MLLESTTLSFWSVLSVEPGKSRTHGELDGERLDTSDLHPETLAEFVPTQESSLNDDLITTIQSKTISPYHPYSFINYYPTNEENK